MCIVHFTQPIDRSKHKNYECAKTNLPSPIKSIKNYYLYTVVPYHFVYFLLCKRLHITSAHSFPVPSDKVCNRGEKKSSKTKLPDSDNLELKRNQQPRISNDQRQTNKHRNKKKLDHTFNGITCAITVNLYIYISYRWTT